MYNYLNTAKAKEEVMKLSTSFFLGSCETEHLFLSWLV
jgi:hypothetical protein